MEFSMKELVACINDLDTFYQNKKELFLPVYLHPMDYNEYDDLSIYIHRTHLLLNQQQIIIESPEFINELKNNIINYKTLYIPIGKDQIPFHILLLNNFIQNKKYKWQSYIEFFNPGNIKHKLSLYDIFKCVINNTAEIPNDYKQKYSFQFKNTIMTHYSISKKEIYLHILELLN